MKTIEEKAKAYDVALELMKDCIPDENGLVHISPSDIFPELKESEDEKIRKELIRFFSDKDEEDYEGLHPRAQIVAWLEKQGEHARFIEAIQVGDQVTKNEDDVLVNLSQLKRVAKPSEQNQGEQKPADKVEPKFKVGDWVVRNGETLQISGIDTVLDGTFHYWFTKGTWLSSKKMGNAMLWTIQDAKDGDVLATEDWIFIFKKISSNGKPVCHCHYDIDLGFRIDTNSYIATGSEIYPATKEQHDLLFQKIKEAGYEWDAEKKELKKVEQKPAWSEEDEDAIGMAIIALEDMYDEDEPNATYGGYNLPFNKAAERLKSIKDRVQPQQELSEDDESWLNDIISDAEQGACLDKQQIDWLKHLKDRVQPKQEWSEEGKDFMYGALSLLTELKDLYGEGYGNVGKCIGWLKSLRPQNWTKEDKERYISCLQKLSTGNPEQPETINSKWFKEHVYPQKRWKPSKEQIIALRWILNNVPYGKYKEEISGLLDQIKDL